MLARVLRFLRCPVCHRPLAATDGFRSARCPAGHTYDLARPGYLPLLAGPLRHPGDPPRAVTARAEFLASGAYEPVAAALAAAAGTEDEDGLVVDVGAGTGYHLARVLTARPHAAGLAVDTSKPALRRAARAHPRAAAVLADVWRPLPLADGVADLLLNVFAPRNGAEFARLLAPGGRLLVVTPAPGHLTEVGGALREVAGVRWLRVDPEKPARVAAGLARWFDREAEEQVRYQVPLTRRQLTWLVTMGPSGHHTDPAALAGALAAAPEPLPVTVAVQVGRYRHRNGGVDRGRDRPPQVDRSTSSQPRGGPW